jgi:hypothetical protein
LTIAPIGGSERSREEARWAIVPGGIDVVLGWVSRSKMLTEDRDRALDSEIAALMVSSDGSGERPCPTRG